MDTRQEAKLRSYLAVKKVCDDSRSFWAGTAGFKNPYDAEFVPATAALSALREVQETARTGVSLNKQTLTGLLIDSALAVADALCIYANRTKDTQLLAFADIDADTFVRLADDQIDDRALLVHDKAKAILDAETATPPAAGAPRLADTGLDAAELLALHNLLAAYAAVVQSPRAATVKITTATEAISCLFEATDKLLAEVLDKMARRFKAKNIEFYDAYTAARVIVDAPSAPEEKPAPAPAPAPAP